MGINSCTFEGRITRKPRYGATGDKTYISFSIACNRRVQVDGIWTDVPEFIDCIAFNRIAEYLNGQLQVGTSLCVTGELRMETQMVPNTDIAYKAPIIFVSKADIGEQPRRHRQQSSVWDVPGF